ncbi:fasciclin domain-containing protein [Pedobacter sp. MW01-1-1]|uniref:fasciclin domain-containing protein n=1 Tax=Pedobacter sp. MW01-1-1 TaxID=3383027 RepID=UPI003FEFB26C
MKTKTNIFKLSITVMLAAFMFFLFNACRKESYTTTTTTDVNITGYLEKYPEKFSLFLEILDRSGTKGYLGAYGKYTIFTPTNDAVNAWLKALNKTSVEQVSPEDLKNLVRFHVLPDTLATNRFTDGKLPQITLYGQYLQTGVIFTGGASSYIINKQAKVTQSNVRVGNGIMHIIDQVLLPATKTLAQSIETNARYSIFTQALKETGFYDSLNYEQSKVPDTTRRFQTVILESDSAINAAGYPNYAALKAKLSKTGNPKSHTDSLWMYVAYHLSTGASYSADIVSSSSINTLAPAEIVTTKLAGTKILLNDDEFNGVKEPGVELNRSRADITASNGVFHEVKDFYKIKPRFPTGVFFDIGDQPELRALPNWRTPGQTVNLIQNGKFITEGIRGDKIPTQAINYTTATLPLDASGRSYANQDVIQFNASTSNNQRNYWIEIRSPMLVKGKYKIWICYTYNVNGPLAQVGMDVGTSQEQLLPNLVDFTQQLTSSGVPDASSTLPSTDGLMLANGFKRYLATVSETNENGIKGLQPNTGNGWKIMPGKLVGTADIKTTDKHWLRLSFLRGNNNNIMNIDMIHFIPVDDDQNYPRFSPSGAVFKRP